MKPPAVDLEFRGRRIVSDRPLVMAIVNRTPDSFYDQGATFAAEAARTAVARAVDEGADMIDLGGVAASPGEEVTAAEEAARVVPLVEWARDRYPDLLISIDTWRHEVGDAACRAGADILNDAWAAADPKLIDVAAAHGAGYVCTHTGGRTPAPNPSAPATPTWWPPCVPPSSSWRNGPKRPACPVAASSSTPPATARTPPTTSSCSAASGSSHSPDGRS